MKRLIGVLVGTVLLAAFGCGGGEGDGGGENAPEFPVPLAIGNWWYSQNVSDSTSWDTTKIVDDTVYDGHDAFVGITVYEDDSGNLVQDTAIAYYADSFLVMHRTFDNDSMQMEVDVKAFKQNMAVGDTWTMFTYDTTMSGFPVTYKSWATVTGQEDITVPAGSFSGCYVILDTMQMLVAGSPVMTNTQKIWLAYGVGTVYSVTSSDSSQLMDYHIE